MDLDEFVSRLEADADPKLVSEIHHWPDDTKLYMYLHSKQLAMMDEFNQKLSEIKNA